MVRSYVPHATRLAEYPDAIKALFLGNGKRNQKVKPNTLFRKNHKEQALITMERNEYAIDEQESEPYRLTMDDAAFMLLGYRNPRLFAD